MESASTPALLLLDLPTTSLAGIDLLSFTTTPRFKGVKNLPAGFHFAFAGNFERHGIWFRVPPKSERAPLFIAKWDEQTESLVMESDEAEVLRWRANLGGIWRENLTPYRQSSSKDGEEEEEQDWPSLTAHISHQLLTRISPSWHLSSTSSSPSDHDSLPLPTSLPASSTINLLPLNLKQTFPPTATGSLRSKYAQDRSWYLASLTPNPEEILGEMEFCFLMTLTLNNFACFEQWKRLLEVILTCKETVPEKSEFFCIAIGVLRRQVRHCKDAEEGGIVDLSSSDPGDLGYFLKLLLLRFRHGLETLPGSTALADVVDELDDLLDYLRTQHGWNFDDDGGAVLREGMLELEDGEQVRVSGKENDDAEAETGEFAPTVVELTGSQARLLGVSVEDGEKGKGERIEGLEGGLRGVVQDDESEEESEEEEQELEDMDPRM